MRETIIKVIAIIMFVFLCSIPIGLGYMKQEYKYNISQEYRKSIHEYDTEEDRHDEEQ